MIALVDESDRMSAGGDLDRTGQRTVAPSADDRPNTSSDGIGASPARCNTAGCVPPPRLITPATVGRPIAHLLSHAPAKPPAGREAKTSVVTPQCLLVASSWRQPTADTTPATRIAFRQYSHTDRPDAAAELVGIWERRYAPRWSSSVERDYLRSSPATCEWGAASTWHDRIPASGPRRTTRRQDSGGRRARGLPRRRPRHRTREPDEEPTLLELHRSGLGGRSTGRGGNGTRRPGTTTSGTNASGTPAAAHRGRVRQRARRHRDVRRRPTVVRRRPSGPAHDIARPPTPRRTTTTQTRRTRRTHHRRVQRPYGEPGSRQHRAGTATDGVDAVDAGARTTPRRPPRDRTLAGVQGTRPAAFRPRLGMAGPVGA